MYSNGFPKKWFWNFFMMWFFWKKFSNRDFSKIPHQKYFLKSLKVLFLCVFYGNISQTLGTFFLPFPQLKIGVVWGNVHYITAFILRFTKTHFKRNSVKWRPRVSCNHTLHYCFLLAYKVFEQTYCGCDV